MQDIEKAWELAKYQLELEGFRVTEGDKKQVLSVILGRKSREDLIHELKEKDML